MARPHAPDPWEADELRNKRRIYLNLSLRWDLSGPEALVLLGEPEEGEAERRERLHVILGVNLLLQLVHPGPERTCGFLRKPHPTFGDAAPLQVMLAAGRPGMLRVRDHLVEQARR